MLLGILNKHRGIVKIALFVVISDVTLFVLYISKPDRGGINRCEKIFGFDSLNVRGIKMRPLYMWEPFEYPKFRMKIETTDTDKLMYYFATCGYNEWTEGEIYFGSFSMGGNPASEILYSRKETENHVYYLVHDRNNHLLYSIVSR